MTASPDRQVTICHVITGLETGGAERMLHKLVSAMDPSRYRSVVISLRTRGTMASRLEDAGAIVHAVDLNPARPSPACLTRLVMAVHRARPTIIQGWMYHGNLAATLSRAFGARVPVLWNVRASIDGFATMKRSTAAVVKLGARMSQRADRIVYNSREGERQHVAIGYAADRSVVIPNGFDCATFRPDKAQRTTQRRALGIPDDALVLGQIARRDPMKNQEGLIRAAAKLRRKYPHLHVVMAGRGVDRSDGDLAALIATVDLADRVHLLGERSDVHHLLAALDVYVSPSHCLEGFPNAIGEAMACGVPCVVTAVGDGPDIVADTGLTVPPRDADALSNALDRMLMVRPHERMALGAQARQRVETSYSLAAITASYEALYESVSGR